MEKISLFLDSGAYSAWTQGVEINIDEYIQFIKDNEDIIDVYSVLDVIGDAEGTMKNQEYMEKAGLSPIPCYHYQEPKEYLDHYVNNYGYISLGGMVGGTTDQLRVWLDDCWFFHLIDENRMPRCKVHGFGMTSLPLMKRYPWYSVDSTSWVMTSRMGAIFVPMKANGEWDYQQNSLKVVFSSKSPASDDATKSTLAFNAMKPGVQKIIREYLAYRGYEVGESVISQVVLPYELHENQKWFGKADGDVRDVETIIIPGLCNSYKQRDEMNILYFIDLANSFPKWPWPLPDDVRPKKGFLDDEDLF